MHSNTRLHSTLAMLLAGLASTAAGARAANPRSDAKIIETTPGAYTLTVSVGGAGRTGHLALSCPDGHGLGASARFTISNGRFTAIRAAGHKTLFRFRGFFDQATHVRGSGSVRTRACGSGTVRALSEGAIGTARMLYCPPSSPESPLTAGVPYPFAGIVPNAALGTQLRLEYTDPGSPTGQPAVVHLGTDSRGRFSSTHAFPGDGGVLYGASATPRWPDDPLAAGIPCGMELQG
jgi:hypothetical protein